MEAGVFLGADNHLTLFGGTPVAAADAAMTSIQLTQRKMVPPTHLSLMRQGNRCYSAFVTCGNPA
jgi:hypothetical protein